MEWSIEKGKEMEWRIEKGQWVWKHKVYITHNSCGQGTPVLISIYYSPSKSCWKCRKPIPDEILFQALLLRSEL